MAAAHIGQRRTRQLCVRARRLVCGLGAIGVGFVAHAETAAAALLALSAVQVQQNQSLLCVRRIVAFILRRSGVRVRVRVRVSTIQPFGRRSPSSSCFNGPLYDVTMTFSMLNACECI